MLSWSGYRALGETKGFIVQGLHTVHISSTKIILLVWFSLYSVETLNTKAKRGRGS